MSSRPPLQPLQTAAPRSALYYSVLAAVSQPDDHAPVKVDTSEYSVAPGTHLRSVNALTAIHTPLMSMPDSLSLRKYRPEPKTLSAKGKKVIGVTQLYDLTAYQHRVLDAALRGQSMYIAGQAGIQLLLSLSII
jgi:hypothetical protein